MKVLVTGAGGMLGRDVTLAAGNAGHDVVGFGRTELDVTDEATVATKIEAERPDVVINCAAWTDVDGAEEAEEAAMAVSGKGAGHVAAAAATVGAGVVYVSSDYVFDGSKGAPYIETDQPAPLSAYGRTKLAGEEATAAANKRHFVVRSSWLFGIGGSNFVETMLRLATTQNEVLVVRDQVGSPTYTWHLAYGIVRLIEGVEFGIHRDIRAGPGRVPGALGDDRDAGTAGPAPALLRSRQPAPARDRAARLARRPRRLHLPTLRREGGHRMKLLVTGAAGFIGSTYVRLVAGEHEVRVLDKLTYAGRRENLPEGTDLVVGAIEDPAVVREAMEGCDAVVNFAAESHVDRSIDDQDAFARTHVIGTGTLLDAARELGVGRYLQVSTDEVYGSIEEGSFTETSPLDPSSPYSATKTAGDLLVSAHFHTYGTETVICRGSNNYGPRQYPEKLIPLMVLNAIHGDSLPIYGDGRQVRNWLYVEDFCRGIHTVLERGRAGEAYNVGGPDECENIEVVKRVIELTGGDESLIEYVQDRPGHDRRYSLGSDKIREQLGWEAQVRFAEGLERTVQWYRDNEDWWGPIRSGAYREYYEKQYGRALG
jgi:dTDP-glucose 4,6-dehydratase